MASQHLITVVRKLLGRAHDPELDVREAVVESLRKLSRSKGDVVLGQSLDFLTSNPKLTKEHRIVVLDVVKSVVDGGRAGALSEALGKKIIEFCAAELTKPSVKGGDYLTGVSEALSAVSSELPDAVLEALLAAFPPGQMPPYFIVKTLSELAHANPVHSALNMEKMLSLVVPVLGLVRREPDRWLFTTLLGRFAESIIAFNSDADAEQKDGVNLATLAANMGSGFDVIFTNWRSSKEAQVRLAVAESIGVMCRVISTAKFSKNLDELLQMYVGLFRKENTAKFESVLALCHGLDHIMQTVTENDGCTTGIERLPESINQLLSCLHPMASVRQDYTQPLSLKAHGAVLRCIEQLGRAFRRQTVAFIIERLSSRAADARTASVIILRHMVNSLGDELDTERALIMSSVQVMKQERDYTVRKAFMQLVMSMADRGFLELEGGRNLVFFTALQASISDPEIAAFRASKAAADPGAVSPDQLRKAAEHILFVLATKVPSAAEVLWPFLFELLPRAEFTPAVAVLCRCLAALAKTFSETESPKFFVDFDANPNLPSAAEVLTRLIVVLSLGRRKECGDVLACLEACGRALHPSLPTILGPDLVELGEVLAASPKRTPEQPAWEMRCTAIFEKVTSSGDERFVIALADALAKQRATIYENNVFLKRHAHALLGVALQHSLTRDFVAAKIDQILVQTNHQHEMERKGASQALGTVGKTYLDLVLDRLAARLVECQPQKKTGFFSFGAKKPPEGSDFVRCTIIRSWGYVVAHADKTIVTSRLEAHVLPPVLSMFKSEKKPHVHDALVRCIDLIAQSVSPERLGGAYVLKERDELVRAISGYLAGAPELRVLALNCLSTLVALPPAWISQDDMKVRDHMLERALPLLRTPPPQTVDDRVAKLMAENVKRLLSSLLRTSPSTTALVHLMRLLEKFVISSDAQERAVALDVQLGLVETALDVVRTRPAELQLSAEPGVPSIGEVLARLLPRCGDSKLPVRTVAVAVLRNLLLLDEVLLQWPPSATATDPAQLPLEQLAADVAGIRGVSGTGKAMESIVEALHTLDSSRVSDILASLCSGLVDSDPQAVFALTAVWRGLAEKCAPEIGHSVPRLVEAMLAAVQKVIGNKTVTKDALAGLCVVAAAHFRPVVNTLCKVSRDAAGASKPVPLAPENVAALRALSSSLLPVAGAVGASSAASKTGGGGSTTVQEFLFDHLLLLLSDTPVAERKPTAELQVATAAMRAIFSDASPECVRLVDDRKWFSLIFSALICRVGSSFGVDDGASMGDAVAALRALLGCSKWALAVDSLKSGHLDDLPLDKDALEGKLGSDNTWNVLRSQHYESGLHRLVHVLLRGGAALQPDVVDEFDASAGSPNSPPSGKSGRSGKSNKSPSAKDSAGGPGPAPAGAAGAGGSSAADTSTSPGSAGSGSPAPAATTSVDASEASEVVESILEHLKRFAGKPYPGLRVAAAAFVAESVAAFGHAQRAAVVESAVALLLPLASDPIDRVRSQALRGLGHLDADWPHCKDRLAQQASSVLTSLVSALEDKAETVASTALRCLDRVLNVFDEPVVHPLLQSICFRVRPAFERADPLLRVAALKVFADLVRFGTGTALTLFRDQVHAMVPTYLILLHDPAPRVRQAAVESFARTSQALASEQIAELAGRASSMGYEDFVSDLAVLLVAEAPGRVPAILQELVKLFRSPLGPKHQGNAAIAAALLVSHVPAELKHQVDSASVCSELIRLLDDEKADIRLAAARALAFLEDV